MKTKKRNPGKDPGPLKKYWRCITFRAGAEEIALAYFSTVATIGFIGTCLGLWSLGNTLKNF